MSESKILRDFFEAQRHQRRERRRPLFPAKGGMFPREDAEKGKDAGPPPASRTRPGREAPHPRD